MLLDDQNNGFVEFSAVGGLVVVRIPGAITKKMFAFMPFVPSSMSNLIPSDALSLFSINTEEATAMAR